MLERQNMLACSTWVFYFVSVKTFNVKRSFFSIYKGGIASLLLHEKSFYLGNDGSATLIDSLVSFTCRTLTPGHDAVQKVTLVPRGQARGLTWFIPADDPTLISKQQLFARIVGGLGGRAAEEIIFGEPEVTTGAAGDLQQITGLARQVNSCSRFSSF